MIIFPSQHSPTGAFWQKGPILWVHELVSPVKIVISYPSAVLHVIQKGYKLGLQTFGMLPDKVITPYTQAEITWLQNFAEVWTLFLRTNPCEFDKHYPSDKLVTFFKNHPVCFPKVISLQPLAETKNVFTDSSSTRRAVVVSPPDFDIQPIDTKSAQVTKLIAVQMALEKYADIPFNHFTDSQYISKILAPLETAAYIASVSRIQMQLLAIQALLLAQSVPIYVGHLWAHADLPGPLSKGNALADQLTPQICAVSQESYGAAEKAHNHFHLNAGFLRFHFKISQEEATDI